MHMLFSIVLAAMAAAPQPAPELSLRLVSVRTGMGAEEDSYAAGRLQRSERTALAKSVGLDLLADDLGWVAHKCADGNIFYLFYTALDGCFADRPYVIQRVKRITRIYANKGDTTPSAEQTAYRVDVFKTHCGGLKCGQQAHFGRFGGQTTGRREVIKEYEIGFGEIPGACAGKNWPFDAGKLARCMQDFQSDAGVYDNVQFSSSLKWVLRVSIDSDGDGDYHVACEQLGFDLPTTAPPESATDPAPIPASSDIVLTAGGGFGAVKIGRGKASAVDRELGAPLQVTPFDGGKENRDYQAGLTVSFDGGAVNTIITHFGFQGRTSEGVKLGDKRSQVRRAYGEPDKGSRSSLDWAYKEGIRFCFDGEDRVSKIVISKGRAKKKR